LDVVGHYHQLITHHIFFLILVECGIVQPDSKIKLDDKIIGYQLKIEKKKIYVSVGHKISLKTAIKIVKELILDKNWYPEPLRLADLNSKLVK